MHSTNQAQQDFLETLWEYYAKHGRTDLPWRQSASGGVFDPYKIMVSELMLQQTQVVRVIPKFDSFLTTFPTVQSLAAAEQGEVLREWQGLGYNRRAKFLWLAAQQVAAAGSFPTTLEGLVALPGIGKNTAGAILAYAYNQPSVFIETNVRTVYIHHFFHDRTDVSDKEITEVLEATIDREQPREFYWALMDYGTHLKVTVGNVNRASKHYAKQSRFHGSRRQVRGAIIRELTAAAMPKEMLRQRIADERCEAILDELVAEGLVQRNGDTYRL